MSPNQREILSARSTISGKQEYLTSTNGELNTTASVSISGTPIPITGATTAIGVAIVDSSGNQISSFGGGTQYTDGATPPTHPIGNTIEWSDGTNWQTVSTAKPLPVTASVTISGVATAANQTNANQKTQIVDGSGNVIAATSNALNTSITNSSIAVTGTFFQATQPISGTVTANAGTNLNTSALALESGGNLATIAGAVTTSVVQTNEKQINGVAPLMGNGVTGTGSQRVTIASDNTAFSVNATLSAETTKVIGTVNQGTSPWVISGTVTANAGTNLNTSALALESGGNLATLAGTVSSSKVNVNIASGNPTTIAVTQGTAASLNATVVGTGTFAVQNAPVAPTTVNNGKTTVTTAGTRVVLASSTVVQSVTIKALAANTGTIYVGNSSVSSSNGFQLAAGDTVSLDIANLNTVNIDSSVNAEGVTYAAVT